MWRRQADGLGIPPPFGVVFDPTAISSSHAASTAPSVRPAPRKRAVTLLCGAAGAVKKCRRLMLKNVPKDKVLAGVLLF